MRQRLVIGNWKMHGARLQAMALADALVRGWTPAAATTLAVCPPFVHIPLVAERLAGSALAWGAQHLSEHDSGAFTGEVSAPMLADYGCRYVLVGHSERRSLYGETDTLVAARFLRAQAAGLVPVLCLGETLAERDAGRAQAVIASQLDAVLAVVGAAALRSAVIAYEPVWAIGSGRTAHPADAQAVHAFIRSRLTGQDAALAAVPLLYGGSVKPDNAGALFAEPDIDGALVGGASLDAEAFLSIGQQAL